MSDLFLVECLGINSGHIHGSARFAFQKVIGKVSAMGGLLDTRATSTAKENLPVFGFLFDGMLAVKTNMFIFGIGGHRLLFLKKRLQVEFHGRFLSLQAFLYCIKLQMLLSREKRKRQRGFLVKIFVADKRQRKERFLSCKAQIACRRKVRRKQLKKQQKSGRL